MGRTEAHFVEMAFVSLILVSAVYTLTANRAPADVQALMGGTVENLKAVDGNDESSFSVLESNDESGRHKRDLQEIIRGHPVDYVPVVMKRLRLALEKVVLLLDSIVNYLQTSLDVITTTETSSKTTTIPVTEGLNSTADNPLTTSSTTTQSNKPVNSSISSSSSVLPSTVTTIRTVQATPGLSSALTSKSLEKMLQNASERHDPNESNLQLILRSRALPSNTSLQSEKSLNVDLSLLKNVVKSSKQTDAEQVSDTLEVEKSKLSDESYWATDSLTHEKYKAEYYVYRNIDLAYYRGTEIIMFMRKLANISEKLMDEQLNVSTVRALESSVDKLLKINKSISSVDKDDSFNEMVIWVEYARMSCRHALLKVIYQRTVYDLLGSADDIVIVIATAFCVLVMVFIIGLCYLTNRPMKTTRGDYKFRSSRNQAFIPTSSQAVRMSHPRISAPSTSSSPSETIPNPQYSSHRGVDVMNEPVTFPLRPATARNNLHFSGPILRQKYQNCAEISTVDRTSGGSTDEPGELDISDVVATVEQDRTGVHSDAHVSDRRRSRNHYKDPRRNRRESSLMIKDNDGFTSGEVIGIRPNSESVL